MDLSTIRLYLEALGRLMARHPAQARELINELASPLNQIAEVLAPIEKGGPMTPFEHDLRDEVQHIRRTRGI